MIKRLQLFKEEIAKFLSEGMYHKNAEMLVNCFACHCFYKSVCCIKYVGFIYRILWGLFNISIAFFCFFLLLLPSQSVFIFEALYLPCRKENLNTVCKMKNE